MFIFQIIKNSPTLPFAIAAVAAVLLAIYGAIVMHELAHGYVALWSGDDTAKMAGRLTLNPAKHFSLLGFGMLLLVGFGFANPVPVNPYNFANYRKGSILVSIAGVCTNLILAFLFTPLIAVFSTLAESATTEFAFYIGYFLYIFAVYFVSLNVNFALFNILPLYPLDGYRLINCFVPSENRVLTFLRQYSFIILIVFVILGNVSSGISPLTYYMSFCGGGLRDLFQRFWSLFGLSF